jgi:hypothetical protein
MHFLLAWLLSVILFASAPITYIDPKIKPYYDEFIAITKNECPNLETPRQLFLQFSSLKNEEIGLCTFYLVKRDIKFDESFWEITPDYGRRQLVFHELTHCVLDTHHVDDQDNYMNPYLIYIPEVDLLEQLQKNIKNNCDK